MPRADLVYRRAATSSISGPHHQVELSRELWQIVLDDLDDRDQQDLTEPDRLCVVLRHIAASQRRRSGNSQALQSIVCWARKEQSVHASNGKVRVIAEAHATQADDVLAGYISALQRGPPLCIS